MKRRNRQFAIATLIALTAWGASNARSEGRLGGDISICKIRIEDGENQEEARLSMTSNEIAIGSEGTELCISFLVFVARAIDAGIIQPYPKFRGGGGRSIDLPVEVDDIAEFANPMAPLFAYLQSQKIEGRYTGFALISRAHDRYVFSLSLGEDGEIASYYLDCTAWVARKLMSQQTAPQ